MVKNRVPWFESRKIGICLAPEDDMFQVYTSMGFSAGEKTSVPSAEEKPERRTLETKNFGHLFIQGYACLLCL